MAELPDTDAEVSDAVTPACFSWRMDLPSGPIDYVAELRGDTWTERGTRTGPDGRTIRFLEMTLRRQ